MLPVMLSIIALLGGWLESGLRVAGFFVAVFFAVAFAFGAGFLAVAFFATGFLEAAFAAGFLVLMVSLLLNIDLRLL
jgi:hypothetical protein